jgi:hypothetical protein
MHDGFRELNCIRLQQRAAQVLSRTDELHGIGLMCRILCWQQPPVCFQEGLHPCNSFSWASRHHNQPRSCSSIWPAAC